jgi:hypothetical protein
MNAEQCEAIAAAAEEARKANYWSTPDPYLILLFGALFLAPFVWMLWSDWRENSEHREQER